MTNIIQVDKKKMDALKALADVNMQVSAARDALAKIKTLESDYLTSREKQAVDRVAKVLEESESLLSKANENYDEITRLAQALADCTAFLLQVHDGLAENIRLFGESRKAWERDVTTQEERIAEVKQGLKIERTKIDNAWVSIDATKAKLLEDQKKLDSDRGALERALSRLGKGRI